MIISYSATTYSLMGLNTLIEKVPYLNISTNPVLFRLHQEGYLFLVFLFIVFAVAILISNLLSFVFANVINIYSKLMR
jgi:hypothetical protein